MKTKLRNINEQVIVITGASSGIGLVTARMAAKGGASVVVAARNEEALRELEEELLMHGHRAKAVRADVASHEEVERLAQEAVAAFGRIDTWVNNASVSIYGKLMDVPIEDQRQLFEIDFWGVVNGCRVAVGQMRHRGGALINVGSILSEISFPLQGIYSAAKHAVQGYTEALRMELEHDGIPISLTLIKPGTIDTPYVQHAKNYLEREPRNVPPYYAPETVAEAILHAAHRPVRELHVGGASKMMSLGGKWAPGVTERILKRTMFSRQITGERARSKRDNLREPAEDGNERGDRKQVVFERSAYTKAAMMAPWAMTLLAGAAVLSASRLGRR